MPAKKLCVTCQNSTRVPGMSKTGKRVSEFIDINGLRLLIFERPTISIGCVFRIRLLAARQPEFLKMIRWQRFIQPSHINVTLRSLGQGDTIGRRSSPMMLMMTMVVGSRLKNSLLSSWLAALFVVVDGFCYCTWRYWYVGSSTVGKWWHVHNKLLTICRVLLI